MAEIVVKESYKRKKFKPTFNGTQGKIVTDYKTAGNLSLEERNRLRKKNGRQ